MLVDLIREGLELEGIRGALSLFAKKDIELLLEICGLLVDAAVLDERKGAINNDMEGLEAFLSEFLRFCTHARFAVVE